MSCKSCQQHRENIKQAVKAGDVKRTAASTVDAVRALGENAGRKLVKTFRKVKK